MTGVEIILILAGLVMMIGSFMVTEKLSGAELDRIAELSQNVHTEKYRLPALTGRRYSEKEDKPI